MPDINPVLGIFSLYHELPGEFTNRFSTVEQKWFDQYRPIRKDTIFHSSLSLVDEGFQKTLEQQHAFDIIRKYHIRRFSFDIGPCYSHVEIKENRYFGIGGRLTISDIHALCAKRISWLRDKLPRDCEISIENLNYYDTGAYEDVCDPAFYNDICEKYSLGLVLDLAHAQVTAHNKKESSVEHLKRFNRNAIREFHLSKISVLSEDLAIDAHALPDRSEFQLMYELIEDSPLSYDVVIEFWFATKPLMAAYDALKVFLNEKNQDHPAA